MSISCNLQSPDDLGEVLPFSLVVLESQESMVCKCGRKSLNSSLLAFVFYFLKHPQKVGVAVAIMK